MLDYKKAFYELVDNLKSIYEAQEASAIAHEVLFHITGQDKLQRLLLKETFFTQEQQQQYDRMQNDLNNGRPLQYVLGKALFLGREYKVDESVLIPRPETEELVQWIIKDHKGKSNISILDIGTGSGCIPISLKLALPNAAITSCDISNDALQTAKENADALQATIDLKPINFLDEQQQNALPQYDIIVSNPPYIPENERELMDRNVKDFEPETALFVPTNDPLLFYKAIATFGLTHLTPNGSIYCEVHVDHAQDTQKLFESVGHTNTELRKDMHGNWRMLKAWL